MRYKLPRFPALQKWQINLGAAFVAQFLCMAGFSAAFPFLPFYIRELGITDVHQVELLAGGMVSAGAISMALVSPIWGMLADRRGRKLMVERAAFGGAVIMTAMAFVSNVQQLFVLRVIAGFLTGTVPAFMVLTTGFTPGSRIALALGLMQTAVYAGSSVGPVIGGFVADHIGYRWAFGVTGILVLIGGLLVMFLVEEKFVRPDPKAPQNGIGDSARTIVHSLPVLGAIVALAGLYMANTTTIPILPLFVESLHGEGGLVNTATGSVYGAKAVASAIAAVMIGRLADRGGQRRILVAASFLAALAFLAQSRATSVSLLLPATFAAGLCIGGIIPTANAILARSVPKGQQGAVFGLSNSINSGGRALGPMLGAAIASSWGLRMGFVMTAVIFGAVAVWVFFVIAPKGAGATPLASSKGLAEDGPSLEKAPDDGVRTT